MPSHFSRALRVGLAGAVVVLSPAPVAAAAAEAITVLAADNVITAVGTVETDVVIPEGAEFLQPLPTSVASPGWAAIETDGTYAAVALVARDLPLPPGGGGNPVNVVEVHDVVPDACPGPVPEAAASTGCIAPYNHPYYLTPAPPRLVGSTYHYAVPAGTYRLLVSTDPGKHVTVRFSLSGLGGAASVVPTRPAPATFVRSRAEGPALAALSGHYSHTFATTGFGVLGLWFTSAGDEPGEFAYAECVVAGDAAPANPDDCTPVALGGFAGTVPDDPPLVKQPEWFAASYGGFTLTNSNLGTFETFALAPGPHTNSYRVSRGGRGPAVGTWAWWIEPSAATEPVVPEAPYAVLLLVAGGGAVVLASARRRQPA